MIDTNIVVSRIADAIVNTLVAGALEMIVPDLQKIHKIQVKVSKIRERANPRMERMRKIKWSCKGCGER